MKSSPETTAVVLCAGSGTRAALGKNKMLFSFGGQAIAARTAAKFARLGRLYVVTSKGDEEEIRSLLAGIPATIVIGGETRTDSVRAALDAIGSTDIVVIHDGARPFVKDETIDACVRSAIEYGSGVAAIRSINAIKLTENGKLRSVNRDDAFIVQTPQAFRFDALKAAYDSCRGTFADDSEVFELAGNETHLVEGSASNVKLTTPADFMGLNGAYRVGLGFDVHRLVEGRPLVLCGVRFDTNYGLLGHSDADAPVHALMDAILGAAGMPDIGVLFPDDDPRFEGADSMSLLKEVRERTRDFEVINASVTIMAEKPKISPVREEMTRRLAAALGTAPECVDVSATTTEKLGIIGEGKGIASAAAVLLRAR